VGARLFGVTADLDHCQHTHGCLVRVPQGRDGLSATPEATVGLPSSLDKRPSFVRPVVAVVANVLARSGAANILTKACDGPAYHVGRPGPSDASGPTIGTPVLSDHPDAAPVGTRIDAGSLPRQCSTVKLLPRKSFTGFP
jgi:hypothetical protein